MRRVASFVGLGLHLAAGKDVADHCTGFAAGRKATVGGAPMVGQTDDGEGGPGSSVRFVAAADHPPASKRPVLDQVTQAQIGTIPQVQHTFAYTYADYGIMNEHKVAIGESTCSARITAGSLGRNGTALFSDRELTMIALERCTTARCAVTTMGETARLYGGFYGEGTAVEEGGETLLVADTTEAWVFHILADPTGRSAIWGAQRVPEDHVVVVPNAFVIREMDLTSDDFLLSENAMNVARKFGWWTDPDVNKFDFAGAFSLGEYSNPHYGGRRIWRAYDLLAPSLKLDPFQEITPANAGYPFSVKPGRLIGPTDVFKVFRDYLEGTPFSLVGDELAAGPFNSPLRVASGAAESKFPTGAWERPISIYRNNYAVLSVCHPAGNGVVWFAPHTPHASVFAPVWTSAAAEVPRPYAVDAKVSVDRGSLFWAVSAVSNWAFGSMFSKAILDVRAAQAEWEPHSEALAEQLRFSKDTAAMQSEQLADFAEQTHRKWWDLFWALMGKYSDGYVVTHDQQGSATSSAVGYPDWWLKAAGFDHAVAASASSFQNLKRRMADATEVMKDIDAHRKRTSAQAAAELFV